MNGKDKCKILKQIRLDIAQNNDINFTVAECTHMGDCTGTCPRCESEVTALEKALETRKKQGKKVVLAGISAGIIAANCASCAPLDELNHLINGAEQIAGDIPAVTTDVQLNGKIIAETEPEYILEGDIALPDEPSETPEAEK